MAGRKASTKGIAIPSNSLVASAVRYPESSQRIYQPRKEWQIECYRQYAICGEARFAARFMGHALSRARLFTAVRESDGGFTPVTEGTAFDHLAALFNGKDGQEEMLEMIGIHLTIAGECYLVGRTTDEGDVWEVISIVEMRVTGQDPKTARWSIDFGDGVIVPLTKSDVIIRIWNPNPVRRIEADSPFRSLLPILSEIEWLTRNIFAQISSRLTGAGILFMPQEMEFPQPPPINGKPQEIPNKAMGFMLVLADGMMTALKGDGDPSERVPIIVTAPGDMLDKPRLMQFWSELDSASGQMRQEAIGRFALGMDMPPEQMLGMSAGAGSGANGGGVSHWGAWQIEEATIKMHVEPMLQLVANAITIGYLRPGITTEDGSPVPELVTYDTSALRLRPDRSSESIELWDRGELSTEAMLRENGFDTSDMPDDNERKVWLLRKVASGSATPEMVAAALKVLEVDLGPLQDTNSIPNEARPDPSLIDHPVNDLPERQSVLLAACEPLVFRALERAGNRLREKGAKPPGVPSYETHTIVSVNGQANSLLEDAWPTAAMCLDGIAAADMVIPILDGYVKSLFASGAPHSRSLLREWLELGVKA